MHFILLGFLPLARMRAGTDPKFGAGCGQWFLTTREAYDAAGGHEAVKASFHDGVKLPRAFRIRGFKTDLCDATHLASCRMYRSGGQVWQGLAKNAREGLGSPVGIWFWTIVLGLGQIAPFVLFAAVVGDEIEHATGLGRYYHPELALLRWPLPLRIAAVVFCLLPLAVREHAAVRFRQPFLLAVLHPLSIALLLGLQWYATMRAWFGSPVAWKGRVRPEGTS
jgi:hypothetical protein